MVRCRPEMCLKKIPRGNATLKILTLDEKHCHIHQSLASKNDG